MTAIDLLCDSCRKIYPVSEDGKRDEKNLEEMYRVFHLEENPMMFCAVILPAVLLNLQSFGGCSTCINVIRQTMSEDVMFGF